MHPGKWPPLERDVLARNVQGHSRTPAEGLSDAALHTKYTADTAMSGSLLFHYTSDRLLYAILKSGYIIPGGNIKPRNHVFMSRNRVSDTGIVPDSFKKRRANIGIQLDGPAMLRDNLELYVSDANVVLCPHPIDIKYIVSAKYFIHPRHTLYKRPTYEALSHAWGRHCVCTYCNEIHVYGTQWCISQCWVPITSHAVQDHIACIPVPSARSDELWRVYRLSTKRLQQLVDNDPASSIHPLTRAMNGIISEYNHTGDPQRAAASPQAPPTAEAGAGRPTYQAAAPRPRRAQPYATYGDPARRGASSHLKNADVHHLNTGARKRKDSNKVNYLRHTDRYQRDLDYRTNCERHDPPTPEHLYYENGDYAW
jgi:hypothetical protein